MFSLSMCSIVAVAIAMPGCAPRARPQPDTIRVVSLAPSLTEIVAMLSGTNLLVGRTSACDYPPEVASIPVVGGFGTPSLERLASVRPSLVLDVDLEDESIGRKLRELGIRRERVACRTLADIPAAIRTVGRLLSLEDAAEKRASEIERQVAAMEKEIASLTNKPSVFVEIWNDPLMTAGRNSFISDIVRLAGGINAGDDAENDYFRVSGEWVVNKNPDVIVCLYMSQSNGAADMVRKREGWQTVKAVRNGAVYDGFDNNVMLRPGPRIMDAVIALRRAIGVMK